MTIVKYSLDEFIHDMNALVDEKADHEKIFDVGSGHLERLINNPEAIPDEFRYPADGSNHGSYLATHGVRHQHSNRPGDSKWCHQHRGRHVPTAHQNRVS